ncbi:MAG: glycosyltransferase family 2 protein, partial [Nitrospirota bacterium]|nr:glycosyltransferase family 2 protein [Nitrospirota bacterium]
VGFYLEFFRFLAYKGDSFLTPFVMGGNSGFRRDVCRSLPFSDLSVGDDFLFTWELAQRGKVFLFLPSAAVRHMNKTGLRKVLRYQYELGVGACVYRQTVSPTFKSFLEYVPIAIFLSPPFVMLWISALVLRRRGILEWLKFLPLVPFLFLAHCVWASGFFRELLNQKYSRQQVEENGRVAVMPTPER